MKHTYTIIPFGNDANPVETMKKVNEALVNTGVFDGPGYRFDETEIDFVPESDDSTTFREFCGSVRYFVGKELSSRIMIMEIPRA